MDKKAIIEYIDSRASEIISVSRSIWEFAELSLKEKKSAALYVEKLKSEGVRKEFQKLQDTTKDYKELFVYPTVSEVPVKFSDYMLNYIDNIREKSEWEGKQECKIGEDDYVMHCKVSYSEGKDKASQDDDKMTVSYEIQKKNFKRTQW